MKYGWIAVSLGLASLLSSAYAYEDDVHYGLTRWLALQAGFSIDDAESIARADVDYDNSKMSAVELVERSACMLSKDRPTSEEVQRIHFPGEGAVPGPSKQRAVTPDSKAANAEVQAALLVDMDEPKARLRKFGKSLHPLQDSWSHQGEPDTPFNFRLGCDPLYSWGHPQLRGGWRSHRADLTHVDVASAIAAAHATYTAMCSYRTRVLKEAACTKEFATLSPEVLKLLNASTKDAKSEWFTAHGFKETRFVRAINVPDGEKNLGPAEPTNYSASTLRPERFSNQKALPHTEEAAFMQYFFQEWMTSNDLSALAEKNIALNAYRPRLGQDDARAISGLAAEAELRFWRVRDHGSLERPLEGHGVITRQWSSMPEKLRAMPPAYRSLDEALLPLSADGLPIITWRQAGPDGVRQLVGEVRFRHAPNDVVVVVAGQVGGRYQVISIESMSIN